MLYLLDYIQFKKKIKTEYNPEDILTLPYNNLIFLKNEV